MGGHVHSNSTEDRTTCSLEHPTTHLVACEPTSRTTKQRGPETLFGLRPARSRRVALLVLGPAVVRDALATLGVLLLRRVRQMTAVLGGHLLGMAVVGAAAGVLALTLRMLLVGGRIALLAVGRGGLAILRLAVLLLAVGMLLLLQYRISVFCFGLGIRWRIWSFCPAHHPV